MNGRAHQPRFARTFASLQRARSSLRRRLRLPRRLRVLRPGGFVILGTFALGLAALNTGNNLLYLMLGALLGTIALSGWLSEQVLRSVRITRVLPRAVTAGTTARIEYHVHNDASEPLYALRVRDILPDPAAEQPNAAVRLTAGSAAAAYVPPDTTVRAYGELMALRRGEYRLERIAFGTAFPFGLFHKERDLAAPASLLVWPRTDRNVALPRGGASRGAPLVDVATAAPAGERGDFRGLRDYRPGDDPRDLHWRSTARRGTPIIRDYERRAADEYWIVLDTVAADEEAGEIAIEIAAALLLRSTAKGHRFGLAVGATRLEPREGRNVDAALDALAAVQLSAAGASPTAPAAREACLLVTARGHADMGWADVYHARPVAP